MNLNRMRAVKISELLVEQQPDIGRRIMGRTWLKQLVDEVSRRVDRIAVSHRIMMAANAMLQKYSNEYQQQLVEADADEVADNADLLVHAKLGPSALDSPFLQAALGYNKRSRVSRLLDQVAMVCWRIQRLRGKR